MKWLGVIYALKGDFETALSLFERSAGDKETDGFTIDVIKLPIKILVHFCRKRLGKRSRFDLQGELDRLETKVQGISKNLEMIRPPNHFKQIRASFVVTQSRTPAPAVAVRLVD